ncbi:FecR domain-containing protein [Bacteroides cellulosilyticus]|uniref:FecR domain-containing protein n=1 Tax=Bacteroides cellulosilyticus TaxID=246787 RepID=UPI0022E3E6EC|nr:FecR domain-containing protein [Bacteroides cellulosilyticus]
MNKSMMDKRTKNQESGGAENFSEDACRLMEQDGELSAEEIERLLSDRATVDAAQDLWLMKKAMARKQVTVPDVDEEWKRMQKRMPLPHRRNSWIYGSLIGAAASLLIVVALSLWSRSEEAAMPVVAFQATETPQEVTLETVGKSRVRLGGTSAQAQLDGWGGHVSQTDSTSIVYGAAGRGQEEVERHTLSTPRGMDFRVVLADGTTVWLNAESRLTYPSRFTGGERRVKLEGEAYFAVAKDKDKPFIVETDRMQTRVLGTEFNLQSYGGTASHLTLIHGSVEVKSDRGGDAVRVKPGEDACLEADGTFSLKEIDTDVYVYWKEGYFFFDDTPLGDIMQHIGRWYNVGVVFETPDVMPLRMHYFCERAAGVEAAVEQLNLMQKVKARIKNGVIYIKG